MTTLFKRNSLQLYSKLRLIEAYRATLGLVKSDFNNRLALLSEVKYIILQIRTTNCGSLKQGELLTEVYYRGFRK